jgi:hypothetical protein
MLFEDYSSDGGLYTWTILMSTFMESYPGKLLDPDSIAKNIRTFIDSAKRNGIDTKTIELATDGSMFPTFDLKATKSSFLAMLYDLNEAGLIDTDSDDLEEIISMFLKPEPRRGFDGENFWSN